MTKYVTPENLKSFKKAYLKAKQDKKDTFMFNGQEIFPVYAKYVIEYFEGIEKIRNKYKYK